MENDACIPISVPTGATYQGWGMERKWFLPRQHQRRASPDVMEARLQLIRGRERGGGEAVPWVRSGAGNPAAAGEIGIGKIEGGADGVFACFARVVGADDTTAAHWSPHRRLLMGLNE